MSLSVYNLLLDLCLCKAEEANKLIQMKYQNVHLKLSNDKLKTVKGKWRFWSMKIE